MPSRREKRFNHWREDKERRQLRKELRRRPKSQRKRKRDWTPEYSDDLEMYDEIYVGHVRDERIVPRGEAERREQALAEARAAVQEGGPASAPAASCAVEGERGVVVEVSTGLCRVEMEGDELLCTLRGTFAANDDGFTNAVAVGDRVVVSRDGADCGTVEAVLPRRGLFTRPDTYHRGGRVVDRGRQQLIAANVDQLLIVASWRRPHLWPELIDRYLITAQRNGVTPIVCVNKVDLAADLAECRAALAPYVDLGYRVTFTSALTGKGVGRLRKALVGRTTVLAGMSGIHPARQRGERAQWRGPPHDDPGQPAAVERG
jgi:ribosome biogenesis GTPase